MVKWNYSDRFGGELAPVVSVEIYDETPNEIATDALIDPGADITVIPQNVIAELGPQKIGELEVGGYASEAETRSLYLVSISFNGKAFSHLPVISHDDDYVLIGRDILNRIFLTLDGPNTELEIP